MPTPLDPQAWTDGLKDAYAGLALRSPPDALLKPAYAHAYAQAYAGGRAEGEALRLRHQHEYEQLLFSGRRTRPIPQESADD